MTGLGLNVVDAGVPNDGATPVGDAFWDAGLRAIREGHRRLVVPAGQYRATDTVALPSGIAVDWAPMAAVLLADFERAPGQPALVVTDRGEPLGNGGRYTGLTVLTAPGRCGGVGLQLDATGVSGAHYCVVSQPWVSSAGDDDGRVGSWEWAIVVEGRHNDAAADGLRAATIEYAKLFYVTRGYVYLAKARATALVRPGFYCPLEPAALGPQPDWRWPGVACVDGTSPDCWLAAPDVG